MAFKTTHDNSGVGDTEGHEEEPYSTSNEREENKEYEDEDDADLRQTERSYFELNDSIDDTYRGIQDLHEGQDIDSDESNYETEKQQRHYESIDETTNQTNKQINNELKDSSCVDTEDCNEEEIRNETPKEPHIFSHENEYHTQSPVEDKRIVDARNNGSQIPNLSIFKVPFPIKDLIENAAIDWKPHAEATEATEYSNRCYERTIKLTEFGKIYIGTLEVQTENTEKRYDFSNDETNLSSDIDPEEPNQKEEKNENSMKEGLKETTCRYSFFLVFIVVLLVLGVIALLTFDMQRHPSNNHSSTKLKILSDLYKDDVSRCVKGLYNNSWQNDGFVYAVGDRGRPTYVPPIPPDEPDIPQPNITRNATRDATQNEYNSSTTPAPELDIDDINSHTYIGVQELRICSVNDGNSTDHNEFRNGDPDDFISLRTHRTYIHERDSSPESLPNLRNSSSQFEQTGISVTTLKYQDDHREVSGTSILTCNNLHIEGTSNRDRQVDPTCYYIDGAGSTAIMTRNRNSHDMNQQQSEGQNGNEFANFLFNLTEFESFIPAYLSNRDVRARTFRNPRYPRWPHEYLSPDEMADAGLYFTGTGDKTACFFCRKCMENWEPGDNPLLEHRRLSPGCSYVHGFSTYTPQPQGMFPIRERNGRSELESGSDTQRLTRNITYRLPNSASDPALHNRVTTDIQPHFDDSQGSSSANLIESNSLGRAHDVLHPRDTGGSHSQLHSMVSSRNRLFVDRTVQRTLGSSACENTSRKLQTYSGEVQDESNLPEAYPTNLYELDLYDVRNSESQHPSYTVRNRRSSSRIRQTGESTYDRATSTLPLRTISNNSMPSLSARNIERSSHQTTRHTERIGQRNRIEEILDSSSGRMVLDHGYQRSDVARAIEITLRARTTEREVGNIYQAIMIALSVLRARRRRCR